MAAAGPGRGGEGRESGFPHAGRKRNSRTLRAERKQQPLPHGVQSAVLKCSRRGGAGNLVQTPRWREVLSIYCPIVSRWKNIEIQSAKALLLQTSSPPPPNAASQFGGMK